MITFEEAKKIAYSIVGPTIDSYMEYEEGWYFFPDTGVEYVGESGVAIAKEDGKPMTFVQFISKYFPKPTKEVHKLQKEANDNTGRVPRFPDGDKYVINCGGEEVIGIMDDGWADEIKRYTEGDGDSDCGGLESW